MRALLTQVVERQPGVLFDIHLSRSHQGSSPEHPGRNNNAPGWCVCENCREMSTESAVREYKMVLFIVHPQ